MHCSVLLYLLYSVYTILFKKETHSHAIFGWLKLTQSVLMIPPFFIAHCVPISSWIDLQYPPPVSSCLDHQVTRNSSLRHMKPSRSLRSYPAQCGLILHSLTRPQSLTMNSSIKFWPMLYYYPEEFSRLLGYHFEICGSCCRQVINAAIFSLASQRLQAHQTPSCILL